MLLNGTAMIRLILLTLSLEIGTYTFSTVGSLLQVLKESHAIVYRPRRTPFARPYNTRSLFAEILGIHKEVGIVMNFWNRD